MNTCHDVVFFEWFIGLPGQAYSLAIPNDISLISHESLILQTDRYDIFQLFRIFKSLAFVFKLLSLKHIFQNAQIGFIECKILLQSTSLAPADAVKGIDKPVKRQNGS